MHARTHAHTQPDNFRSGGHGCVQLTEQMQIAVEDELVPDRDEKIIKSPKKEKKARFGRLFKLKVKPASVGCRKGG